MILLAIRALVHFYKWLDEQKTIDEMHNLSERELRDMGVTQYDISYNVKHRNDRD